MRHDRGAGHVPLARLGQRAVDLLQRLLVRDDLVPGIFRQRSQHEVERAAQVLGLVVGEADDAAVAEDDPRRIELGLPADVDVADLEIGPFGRRHAQSLVHHRSEEHTSELQSLAYLVCRLLLEKKKKKKNTYLVTLTRSEIMHTRNQRTY